MSRSEKSARGGPVPPYGTAIQQAIARGDLAKMKKVAAEAKKHMDMYGNVTAALELLRIEIKRLEAKQR